MSERNGIFHYMAAAITIEAVETVILDVPTIRPHVLSVATMQSQAMVIVRLICDAVRTPVGRYRGALASVRADDLAAIPLKALIERTGLDPAAIDDVILGSANQAAFGLGRAHCAGPRTVHGPARPGIGGALVHQGLRRYQPGCDRAHRHDASGDRP